LNVESEEWSSFWFGLKWKAGLNTEGAEDTEKREAKRAKATKAKKANKDPGSESEPGAPAPWSSF
jgi:hypothetical protein